MDTGVVTQDASALQAPAVGITFSMELTQSRSLTFQTAIARDDALPVYDAALDKLAAAAERLKASYTVKQLRVELEQERKLVEQCSEDLRAFRVGIDSAWNVGGRKGSPKASDAQNAKDIQIANTVKAHQMRATTLEAEIAECERVIARR